MASFTTLITVFSCLFCLVAFGEKLTQQVPVTRINGTVPKVNGTLPRTNGTRTTQTDEDIARSHKAVIDELNDRFKNYKENCYPLPKKRCQCVERVNGVEKVTKYDDENVSCKVVPNGTQANRGTNNGK